MSAKITQADTKSFIKGVTFYMFCIIFGILILP